jgi:2-polyprenyl-3-methyl-5-hydroxy-6-metoxy-1,4-benzoquinol methylase
MDPYDFVTEVYRRMGLRLKTGGALPVISVSAFDSDPVAAEERPLYEGILPVDKNAAIADVGSGDGWFLSICRSLGYKNITAVDFRAADKFRLVMQVYPEVRAEDLRRSIGDHFGFGTARYDLIHLSHLIEHIPKYGLLFAVDGMYKALNRDGKVIIRTPNMEGPCALSSYYVTLAHEYGFTGSNLCSLLHICGFDDFQLLSRRPRTPKQKIGYLLRAPFLANAKIKNRLFGVNFGGEFGGELIAEAYKRNSPELFDEKFR